MTVPWQLIAFLCRLTMYLSIIAACMPSIYRILSSLKSGLNDVHMSDIELSTTQGATGSRNKCQDPAGSSSRARRHSSMFPGFRGTDLFSRHDSMTQNDLYTIHNNGFRRDRDGAESTESTQWLTEEDRPPTSGVRKTVEICIEVHDNHS